MSESAVQPAFAVLENSDVAALKRWRGGDFRRAGRHWLKNDREFFPVTAINPSETAHRNAARLYEVVLCAKQTRLSLVCTTASAGIHDYVSNQLGIVMQRNGEIIEMSFFLLPGEIPV